MSALSALAAPVDTTAAPMSAADMAKRKDITATSQSFESSFLSVMLGQMFEGVDEGEYSGGESSKMFRSMMTDAMGKQIAKGGGIGLAASVQAEMLKMQGLT
jgi:peptidoglycan hydrolase FlgJ